jgi:hypothetical protein
MANFLTGLKKRTGYYVLQRRQKNVIRNKRLVNLDEAKTICIVYKVNTQNDFNLIKDLTRVLTSGKKNVLALGFVNRDDIPNYCIAANAGYYFTRKDLNWYGAPRTDYLKGLMKKEFDILIDFSLDDTFINRYISSLSVSCFKVGLHTDYNQAHLDMMIKMEETAELDEFILQTLNYLRMFKSR